MDQTDLLRRSLSDQEWFEALKHSAVEQPIAGIRFPEFPPKQVQERFVGSSFNSALYEAFNFYTFVKACAAELGRPINETCNFLDFGMGWGRYSRFFWKDIPESQIFGADVHPDMVTLCRETRVPGSYYHIDHQGALPFAADFFDIMIAYSVFTHLPERLHRHWLQELWRVAKPGCLFVLTVEPPRFIDFCINEAPKSDSPWHKALAAHVGDGQLLKEQILASKYVYIPTGGGDHLDAEVYGDAVVPVGYIRNNWTKLFNLHLYLDDANRFWQAVVVLTKC